MFADYIEWRAEHPSDDLMTQLLNAEFEDEHGERRTLTRQEVLTYTAVIAGAGNETTGRLIGWLAKVLAEHPDQRREVVEDRSLIPNVIDETLRFEPTGHASARYVTQDVEYHGTTMPAGSPILLLMASANRDPRRYADPDVFDIHRNDIQHLTFGFGLHYCLGANLARLEGRVALDEFLNRFPEWDIDYDNIEARADVDGARLGAHAARPPVSTRPDEPVVVVSNDTHIGPRLVEDLRAVLPAEYLDEFDRFAAETATERTRRDHDARGQRLPRPSELPHRRSPRLGRTPRRLRPRRHRGRRDLPRLHEPGADPVRGVGARQAQADGDRELVGVGSDLQPLARRLRRRRRRTATSGSRTCRCGTSRPRSPRSSGRTTRACGA